MLVSPCYERGFRTVLFLCKSVIDVHASLPSIASRYDPLSVRPYAFVDDDVLLRIHPVLPKKILFFAPPEARWKRC